MPQYRTHPCIKMRSAIILLALVAVAVAIPTHRAADQDLLKKQQDTIYLLEHITGQLPNQELYNLGYNYEILSNVHYYHEPSIVHYYAGMVKAGLVQPQGTVYSNSVSQLRKEVALLTRILLGAKDYTTFLKTAAWARVYVNEGQFVKAYIATILQREDTQGVIPPPLYEIFPQYYIDARVIQEARHITSKGLDQTVVIPVNYTDYLPMGERQLSYFTNDVGLNAYHAFISLAGYMIPEHLQQGYQHVHGSQYDQTQHHIGHGSHFYYLHQQLLAHYNLERLGNGLGPIEDIDFEHVEAPFRPYLQYSNGLQFPARPDELSLTHHELIKNVYALEKRLLEAIDSGYVITPQQQFLSLYQPQGLNILGDIIEGTGRSVNPRYYGSLQAVARQLLGNTPNFENIWSYTPSALELSETSVRDPAFYQLFKRVINLFLRYQQSLPAYQYDDLLLPGVQIEQVVFPNLVTFFEHFNVDLASGIVRPTNAQEQLENTHKIKAQLRRLNHREYQYQIDVQSEQLYNNAVVRVYLGPKFNYDGLPIDINQHRHYFVELDQFVYDLQQGKNVIVRNPQHSYIQSGDYPSVDHIKVHVESAIRSQNPFYVIEPKQIFGFPARLAIPKGTRGGYPLQVVVVISSNEQHTAQYGPVIPEEYQTYQHHQFQIVNSEQYQQYSQQNQQQQQPGLYQGGYQTVEIVPDYQGQGIYGNQIHKHLSYYGHYLYKKYPSLFFHPEGQFHYGHGVSGQNMYGYGQQYGQQYTHQGQQIRQGHVEQGQQVNHQQGQMHQGQYTQGQIHQGQYPQGQIHQGQYPQGQIHQGQYPQGQIYQGQYTQGQIHQGQYPQGQFYQGQFYQQQQGQKIVEGVVGNVPQGVQGGIYQTGYQGQQQIHGQQDHKAFFEQYYKGKHISHIIGGAVSYDNKPLGYPLDRPLAPSAFYVPNMKVVDVIVYHDDFNTHEMY